MAQNFDLHLDPNTLLWTAVTQITAAMLRAWQHSELMIILTPVETKGALHSAFPKTISRKGGASSVHCFGSSNVFKNSSAFSLIFVLKCCATCISYCFSYEIDNGCLFFITSMHRSFIKHLKKTGGFRRMQSWWLKRRDGVFQLYLPSDRYIWAQKKKQKKKQLVIEPLKLPWPADKRMGAPCWAHHSMSARVSEKHFVFHSQYPHPSFISLSSSSIRPCRDMEQSSLGRWSIRIYNQIRAFSPLCPHQTSESLTVPLVNACERSGFNREAGHQKQHIHNVAAMQHSRRSSETTPCWALLTFGCLYLWKIQPINLLSRFPHLARVQKLAASMHQSLHPRGMTSSHIGRAIRARRGRFWRSNGDKQSFSCFWPSPGKLGLYQILTLTSSTPSHFAHLHYFLDHIWLQFFFHPMTCSFWHH